MRGLRGALLGLFILVSPPLFDAATAAAQEENLEAGIEAFDRRDYAFAAVKLERPAKMGDSEANGLLALIHYYYGRFDAARECLKKAGRDDPRVELLRGYLDTPFGAKYGASAKGMEGFSKRRIYFVSTDLGAVFGTGETKSGKKKSSKKSKKPTAGHKALCTLMERVVAAYEKVFKFDRDRKLVSTVVAFEVRKDFVDWCHKVDPEDDMTDTEAFYDPNTRTLVIGTGREAGETELIPRGMEETIIHEAFHQFVDFFVEDCPYWFNEGMAEYFGAGRVDRKKKRIPLGGVPKERLEDIQKMIRSGDITPTSTLLQMGGEAFMMNADRHYPQAWSLCHFLIHGHKKGKKAIQLFFGELMDGKEAGEAFSRVFGQSDLEKLDAEWRSYVLALEPREGS